MANWTKPEITDTYTELLDFLKDRDIDLATMFQDLTGVVAGSLPVGTLRWNDAGSKFEKWNGSAWVDLATQYAVDVATVDGCHAGVAEGNVLKLPSGGLVPLDNIPAELTGKNAATATNVTTNIGGQAINTIFEADGVTVKNATTAGSANNLNGKTISQIFETNSATVKNATAAGTAGTCTGNAASATTAAKIGGKQIVTGAWGPYDSSGTGWSSVHNSTGLYTLTLSPALSSTPVVLVTPYATTNASVTFTAVSSSVFTVRAFDAAGALSDSVQVSFLVIG